MSDLIVAQLESLKNEMNRLYTENATLRDALSRAARLLSVCEFSHEADLADLEIVEEASRAAHTE